MTSHIQRNRRHYWCAAIFLLLQLQVFGQQLAFEQTVYDFGQVAYGSENKRFLKFKNTGRDTLFISTPPKTACGCDMAALQGNKTKYAPNEEGVLVYTFDTYSSRRFDNHITLRTNTSINHSIVRVKWEVLPDPAVKTDTQQSGKTATLTVAQMDSAILQHPVLKNTIENINLNNCYDYEPVVYRMPCVGCNSICDSLQERLVNTLVADYRPEQLFELAKHSGIPMCRIAAMKAYTHSPYDPETIVSFFKAEHQGKNKNYNPWGWIYPYSYVLGPVLEMVSPENPYNQHSYKLDLETYVYLKTIYNHYYNHSGTQLVYGKWYPSNQAPSFELHCEELNFNDIYLLGYPKEKTSFELRGEIKVYNYTKKPLIIAPYRDANTHFDEKSYTIPANGFLEIEFRSTVDLTDVSKPVERKVRMVNYQTKEEKVFTFKANFVRY